MIASIGYVGAIGFKKGQSRLSRLIRLFTGYDFTHTFIVAAEDARYIYVIEAGRFDVGIKAIAKTSLISDQYCFFLPKTLHTRIQGSLDTALTYTDKVYGYLQLLGFAIALIFAKLGWKIKNPIKHGIICSELVMVYINKLFPKLLGNLDYNTTSPGELQKLLLKDLVHFSPRNPPR